MRPPGTRSPGSRLGIRSAAQMLRRRLAMGATADAGFSLIEVLVSIFIFALVSVGVLHSLVSVITTNRDSRARQVAANLAAAEIDRAREFLDVFTLLNDSSTVDVGSDTYHVERVAAWVSDPGADFDCGSGVNSLRYKRVNVTVTWDGMRAGTEPVRSDSLIHPEEKLNDPARGTLLVSVGAASGAGSADVTVTAQAVTALGVPIGGPLPAATTDAQGCAYILRVNPGNYRVTVTKAGYVDPAGASSPVATVGVAAGSSGSAAFAYDAAATISVRYATNSPTRPVAIPGTSMNTTLANTTAYATSAGTVVTAGNATTFPTRSFTAYPFASGFDVFAGTGSNSEAPASTCASVDPGAWPGGVREAHVAAGPGLPATVDVPMGVVSVNVPTTSDRYVRAVLVTPPVGVDDPGCQTGQTYQFGQALNAAGDATLALPYGTWRLYRGTSGSQTITVTAAQLTPVVDSDANGSLPGVSLGDLVVSDPRVTP